MKDTIGNTNNERKNSGRNRATLCIVILAIVLLIGSIFSLWFSFSKPDSSQEATSIDLSSSCGDKISEGGVGEIFALLHYKDGHTASGNFIFQSENDEVLSFPDENSGKFNALKQFEQITISVTCQNLPELRAEFQLEITSYKSFWVTFKYPNAQTYSEVTDQIEIAEGGMMLDAPAPDFGCHVYKWIVLGKNNAEFNPSKGYYWNEDITVEAVFDEVAVSFYDALFHEEFDSTIVTYGEAVTHVTDWKLPSQTDRDGWHFEGWYPDVDSDELQNGLASGRYFATTNILYAKWTTKINLHTTFDLLGTMSKTVQVVYNAAIPELPIPNYRNGGIFRGWYTEQYGLGDELKAGDKYVGAANFDVYDKIQLTVELDYQDETSKNGGADNYEVIYGRSLNDLGLAMPTPQKDTWSFKGWFGGLDEAGKEFLDAQPYLFESSITVYARWGSTFNLYRELTVEGEADSKLYDTIEVVYKQKLNLPTDLTAGEWKFDGYYNGIAGTEGQVESTEKYLGAGSRKLYAKWTSSINFEVPLAEGATESLGVPKIANTTVNSIPVTYGGKIKELPSIEYAYPNGLTSAGWYTDKFGAGASLTSFVPDGRYIGSANQTYYNKTEVDIVFHDELTGTNVSRSVVYGASFTDAFPRFTKTGWTLETNWDVTGIGEVTEDFMRTFRYNLNKTTTCNAIWNITIQYNADVGKIAGVYSEDETYYTVRYGQTLNLDQPTNQGSWRFAGWYDNETLSGETVERQSTSSSEFINFASNHVTQISGKYYIRLYAKWANEVSLDYGYDNDQSRPSGLPTTLQLVYGKTVSASASGQTLPSIRQISGDSNEYIPNGYASGIAWYADKNKEDDKTIVDAATYYYPLSMSTLYFKWEGKTYTIILKYTDSSSTTLTVATLPNVQYDKDMPTIPSSYKPSVNVPEGAFLGYYDGPYVYYNSDLSSARKWDKTEDNFVLYALFAREYTVTLDFNGGSGGTSSVKTAYDKYLKPAIAPKRTGYTFTGYYDSKTDQSDTNRYYDASMFGVKLWKKSSDATLYAGWQEIPLEVSVSNVGEVTSDSKKITVTISSGSGSYYYTITDQNGHLNLPSTTSANVSGSFSFSVTKKDNSSSGKLRVYIKDTITGLEKTIDKDYTTSSCFAGGTRILMADGSYKNIEDVKVGDIVMSWNFVTGQLEAMPVALYWYHGTNIYDVLNLSFSDGTVLRIIGSHGLFDCDLNKYVYLAAENYTDYIGHSFVIYDAIQGYNRITLTNAYVSAEEVGSYSLRTACNDNAFAEGLLTLTAEDFPGYLTYFEVGEDMKYNEEKMQADIEMYGLFTYEDWLNDWSEYITYEEFIAFNGQYFKILIGKGILTYEDIFTLIDGLRNGFDIQS